MYGEEYVGVFRTTIGATEPGASTGVALSILGGRVVSVEENCGPVEDLFADDRVAEFIVEPQSD